MYELSQFSHIELNCVGERLNQHNSGSGISTVSSNIQEVSHPQKYTIL